MRSSTVRRVLVILCLGTMCMKKTDCKTADNHIFWSVNSIPGRVHLLGSVHALPPSVYPLPEVIEQAYRDSSIVVFEVDMEALATPGFSHAMMQLSTLPDGETIEQKMSPATVTSLKEVLQQSGVPFENYRCRKAWSCAMRLLSVKLREIGVERQFGIEQHFLRKAIADDKQTAWFEEIEDQLNLLNELSPEMQEDLLRSVLDNVAEIKNVVPKLLEAWLYGNTHELDDLLRTGFQGYEKLYERLVTDRNKAWMPALERYIRMDENVFVVVGAGHLVGPRGIVNLLTERGFEVTQH